MLNKEQEIQKILRGKFLMGPKLLMDNNSIGINNFSGDSKSAYYEFYGPSSIFRLIVMEPSENLYTNYFVGKDHLLFLLMEEEQVRGGFVSMSESLYSEFSNTFTHLREEQIKELHELWEGYGSIHYKSLVIEGV